MAKLRWLKYAKDALAFEAKVKTMMGDNSPPSKLWPRFLQDNAFALRMSAFLNSKIGMTGKKEVSEPSFLANEKVASLVEDYVSSATPTPSWDGVPTSNIMTELGHSFIANGQQGATSDGYRAYGVATGAADESGQVVRRIGLSGAFGVGGDDTLMIGARADAAIAAAKGGIVYAWNGINDDALSVEQTLDEMKVWKQKAFDAKTVIIFHTIIPCGNDAFSSARKTAQVIADMKSRNARMKAELPGVGCYVVDCFSQLLKAGTEFDLLEKWSPQDGKHPGVLMVQEITGPADALVLKQIYPAGMRDRPTGTTASSFNANVTLLEGLTETFTTTPPTGWANTKATGTTGTIIEYRKATTATGEWCEIRLSGTTATANAAIDILRQIGLQGKLVPGQVSEGVVEYEYDSGLAGILSVQLGTQEAGSTTAINWDNNRFATQIVTPLSRKGAMRTPPLNAIAGITDHRFRLSAYLATDVAPAGVMRFRMMENRAVSA